MDKEGLLANPRRIRSLAAEFGTPFYLVDPSRVVKSMNGLRLGLAQQYPNSEITYSVKTNYLAGILHAVLAAGYRLEVVSRHELALAQSAGAQPHQLLFNGPVKSSADLQFCQQHGIDVNIDSLDELELAAALASPAAPFRAGLRVAAFLHSGALSRFGLDFDDTATVARVRRLLLDHAGALQIVGLHLHHSSQRDAQSYCGRIDRLLAVAALLGISSPAYLDIGGGIASIPPPSVAGRLAYQIDSHEHFASVVGSHALSVCGPFGHPRLILEPGIGVLADSMNYVTSVVAVKPRRGVVCDGSMFDVNPLRSAIPPPCQLVPLTTDPAVAAPAHQEETEAKQEEAESIKLYGATCMEIDQLGVLEQRTGAPPPRVGDLVVVTNVGAYSACLAPEFIIQPAPIYSLEGQQLLRSRPSAGLYQGAGVR